MINESYPWKEGLLRDAALLERWATKDRRSSQRGFLFEKKIFISAYSIRKLFESGKVCTELHTKLLKCRTFKALCSNQSRWNCHKIEENYDLESETEKYVSASSIINQIIHSFSFGFELNDLNHIEGFFVSSHQGKGRFLFLLHISDYLDFMKEVGSDYPDYIHEYHNPEDGNIYSLRCCPKHTNHDKFIKI
ncbi:hypothetical protein [Azospirillum thiophilum]|uniref:hypothetical protein n=1 Tax=Azospirillum thiophilum TaxID=528244 RepID=UPI0011874DBA|nr:hypothetical protein [Azospirillum thiophilum]